MARTNTSPQSAPYSDTHTHEGTPARNLTPMLELRRTLLSCMLWEETFYESGKSVAQRISDLTAEVMPAQAADLAVLARTKMKLRHAPLWVAVCLARSDTGRKVLGWLLPAIIQRPDELAEFLSLYWNNQADRRKAPFGKLAKQVKVGLARAFNNFNAYSLAKYNRDAAVKLRDVMFLVHPKPMDAEQAVVFKQLVDGTLPTPDTWEVALSAEGNKAETWVRLIAHDKLGALALLRNLRNMRQCGVPDTVIANALDRMRVERVLPFRFVAAAVHAPTLETVLERAMFRCLADVQRLAGKTALIVDTSASMWQARVSEKSEMTRADAAAALAMLAREVCDEVAIYTFSDQAHEVPPRKGFALRDSLLGMKGGASCGGLAVEMANRHGYDRIIVITDGQWHYSNLQIMASAGVKPLMGFASYGGPVHITGMGDAKSVAPHPLTSRAYMINVGTYARGVGYGAWTQVDGWSESVLDYIAQSELALV